VKWQLEERSFDMDPRQEIVPCRRLDEIISRRVAVMRIHTSGTEASALASAAGLAKRGLLGAVALQFPTLQLARQLWHFGLQLELGGRTLAFGDDKAFDDALQDPASGGHHAVLLAFDDKLDDMQAPFKR